MLTEVCAFLGTFGILHIFVKNFAHCTHHLTKLTCTRASFKFGPDQINAQKDLVKALQDAKPLVPINYMSPDPIILAVDTSYIAISFYLCQCISNNRKQCHYNQLDSIMLNNREVCFSQPKLKLYGLFRALQVLCMYLLGVCNLIIKVNAQYIKGIL